MTEANVGGEIVPCGACGGSGQIAMYDKDGNYYYVVCPSCGGSGMIVKP